MQETSFKGTAPHPFFHRFPTNPSTQGEISSSNQTKEPSEPSFDASLSAIFNKHIHNTSPSDPSLQNHFLSTLRPRIQENPISETPSQIGRISIEALLNPAPPENPFKKRKAVLEDPQQVPDSNKRRAVDSAISTVNAFSMPLMLASSSSSLPKEPFNKCSFTSPIIKIISIANSCLILEKNQYIRELDADGKYKHYMFLDSKITGMTANEKYICAMQETSIGVYRRNPDHSHFGRSFDFLIKDAAAIKELTAVRLLKNGSLVLAYRTKQKRTTEAALYDLEEKQFIKKLFTANASIHSISDNNSSLAIGGSFREVRISLSGDEFKSLNTELKSMYSLYFAEDSSFVLGGSNVSKLYIWNLVKQVREIIPVTIRTILYILPLASDQEFILGGKRNYFLKVSLLTQKYETFALPEQVDSPITSMAMHGDELLIGAGETLFCVPLDKLEELKIDI
jgi:hypothetical protein